MTLGVPHYHRVQNRQLTRQRLCLALLAALSWLGPPAVTASAMAAQSTPIGAFPICRALPPQGNIPANLQGWSDGAQIFSGLGDFHREITTHSAEAQIFFDQGMRWLFAFNHDEATRSFARAGQIDPGCAMCFWGVALAIGPNYNLALMSEPRGRVAYAALSRARALVSVSSPSEQGLIKALGARYPGDPTIGGANYTRLQTAYADAMRALADRYRGDDDIEVLTAEAEMGVHAWQLWTLSGTPAPLTDDIVHRLEIVLARNPRHVGANHYYLHALEASPDPGRAEAAADRLGALMPGAGHIVHMPSHIYQRIGRYGDAAAVNQRAAAQDMIYFRQTAPLDYYAGYTLHNYAFEAFSAAEIGRRDETIAALAHADRLVSAPDREKLNLVGWQTGIANIYRLRFGELDAVLDEAAPLPGDAGARAAWLFARGYALAARGRLDDAKASRSALAAIVQSTQRDAVIGLDNTRDIYALALLMLDQRLAGASGDQDRRIAMLREAAAAEDRLAYSEPSDWNFPARPILGRVLLGSGQARAAVQVFRDDLRHRPGNGWALCGLADALYALHDNERAAKARHDFVAIWGGDPNTAVLAGL